MESNTDNHGMDRLAHAALNAASAIRGRAQLTRRRVEKHGALDLDRLAADLRTIEEQAVQVSDLVKACREVETTSPPGAGRHRTDG